WYGHESWRQKKLQALKQKYDPTGKFSFYAPIATHQYNGIHQDHDKAQLEDDLWKDWNVRGAMTTPIHGGWKTA
ncbi:hypothetical protein PtrCC142_012205, partial [Pyrenophora tritici-repentis]